MKRRFVTLLLAALFVAAQWFLGNSPTRGLGPQPLAESSAVPSERLSLGGADFALGEVSGLELADGRLHVRAPGQGTFTSSVLEAPLAFTDLGTSWNGSFDSGSLEVEARTSADGVEWADWHRIARDDDLPPRNGAGNGVAGRLFTVSSGEPRHRFAQVRVTLRADQPGSVVSLDAMKLTFIDASEGPTTASAVQTAAMEARSSAAQSTGRPTIISRTAWGCPDGQNSPDWPPEYRPLKAFIIHHTVDSNGSDYAARVRAIWSYHTYSQGWGDIGYNYIIDPSGNIYEGRAGGDDVVGGHARSYNYGSLGVALLGNFDQSQPTSAALTALANLLTWKADQKGIDARIMSVYFVDKSLPTLMGHREATADTACPGQYMMQAIPGLRQQVHAQVCANGAGAEITAVRFSPTPLRVGDTLRVDITVRNSGSATLYSQGPAPGYTYQEGERASAGEYDRVRVAVGFSGSGGADYPYRWGLSGPLAPGASTTVTGYVRVRSAGTFDYFARITREQIQYISAETAHASVQVSPLDSTPPTAQVAVLPEYMSTASFPVSWSGADEASGSGLSTYDVQYRIGAGLWLDWKIATTQTTAAFGATDPAPLQSGQTYFFRARARDHAGNVGAYRPGEGDAHTTVDTLPPTAVLVPLPEYTNFTLFMLYWSGSDGQGGSGIVSYDVQYKVDNGPWADWKTGITATSTVFGPADPLAVQPGKTYAFRVRARDRVGNVGTYREGDGETRTTIDLIPPTSHASVDGGPPTHTWFIVRWTGEDNVPGSGIANYDVDVSEDGLNWQPWLRGSAEEAGLYLGDPGGRYSFRVRARDHAGNLEPKTQADLTVDAGNDPSGIQTTWFPQTGR